MKYGNNGIEEDDGYVKGWLGKWCGVESMGHGCVSIKGIERR